MLTRTHAYVPGVRKPGETDYPTIIYIIEGDGLGYPMADEHFVFRSDLTTAQQLIAGNGDTAHFCPKNWFIDG